MGVENEATQTDDLPSSSSSSGASKNDPPQFADDAFEKQRTEDFNSFQFAGSFEKRDALWAGKDREEDAPEQVLHRSRTVTFGKLKLRASEDDLPSDWWFASTAIPLVAATFAPMANLFSIAALVVSWRNNITTDTPILRDATSEGYPDPNWCYNLNVVSLVVGFIGNMFLLFNFTRRVRYIVALPVTIICFYFASGILIGITASMNMYVPPGQNQIYSQGFWYAIIAACLYVLNSMILMVNMVGYFLGHYPQHFTLTDEQRNLILQTMMFFIWLGGGAGVFATLCDMTFPDALYFCDVTVLTIGFGDFVATNDAGRGLVFPYSVGGIIILGLMVSSIHRFAEELSKENVVRKHVEHRRVDTLSRVVTDDEGEKKREHLEHEIEKLHGARPVISSPIPISAPPQSEPQSATESRTQTIQFEAPSKEGPKQDEATQTNGDDDAPKPHQFLNRAVRTLTRSTFSIAAQAMRPKQKKALVMRKEKDRFDAMRKIQSDARSFKKWSALGVSVIAFGILWCLGAVVFWQAEMNTQGLSYFQALYFCYVSLLTIGYGDFSPKSNAGKPFFVLWSLIAIPTMTILISGMGDTVIASFKRATIRLGDFTLLPKAGMWHKFVNSQPWLYTWLQAMDIRRKRKKGLPVGDQKPDVDADAPTLEMLAHEDLSDGHMTRRLTFAIRRVADDLVRFPGKRYNYEEWADFTRLIRFTKMSVEELQRDEDAEGVIEWDWLDENSPMLSDQSESEWVLDRLCESLLRWLKKNCIGTDEAGHELSQEEKEYAGLTRSPTLVRSNTLSKQMSKNSRTNILSRQESEGRSTGAAMLEFITGTRDAQSSGEAIWSDKARARAEKRPDQERRRSSTKERKGPFARLTHGRAARAPAGGAVTLKGRSMARLKGGVF
ncbi:Outward-rectifier potassium channel TOK1 [Cyphellophora attinorum]|uniref:Outward-rectifier potassium channel TOK1 n=1 Tax=Cyphellophora attinorum TaxID=1664694 RepID=A0A0N1NYT6_9EURO|nr:Outward-rectifier potassium channel TOK1 [Phialophora attinorum]KPI40757.1 Outward-rectifier potassium channel TOK1 [Phialophora attinorum]